MDWVDVIGFQKEAVHVGALRHLLTGERGASVAWSLCGDDRVAGVQRVRTEFKAREDSRRPVDLAAEIDLRDTDPGFGRLAVEVKVDSAWSPRQLRETVAEDAHGVLLALGMTALAADDRDMAAIEGYRWPWRCVRPAIFATIVREHSDGDRELTGYADHLDREADEHARAIDAVRQGRRVEQVRRPRELEHWAFFHEMLTQRDDVANWDRKSLISGPLVTRWATGRADGSGDYLEFMGQGEHRTLCVKTYARPSTGRLLAGRDRLIEQLADIGDNARTGRVPGAAAKTCTALVFSLDGHSPRDAADLVAVLFERVEGASADR